MEQKYYFIFYLSRSRDSSKWYPYNDITKKYPLQWQIDRNEKQLSYEDEEYVVVNWKEISKDEYLQFDKQFNEN